MSKQSPKVNTLFSYFSKTPKAGKKDDEVKNANFNNEPPQKSPKINSKSPKQNSMNKINKIATLDFELYDIVWAKLEGYPWWPALVSNHPTIGNFYKPSDSLYHVQFFDDPVSRSWIKCRHIKDFGANRMTVPKMTNPKWKAGVEEADKALKMERSNRSKLIVFVQEEKEMEVGTQDKSSQAKSLQEKNDVSETEKLLTKHCHQCRRKRSEMVYCPSKSCIPLAFCSFCLIQRYRENIHIIKKVKNWKCPRCRKICNCYYCNKKLPQPRASTAKSLGFSNVDQYNSLQSTLNESNSPMQQHPPQPTPISPKISPTGTNSAHTIEPKDSSAKMPLSNGLSTFVTWRTKPPFTCEQLIVQALSSAPGHQLTSHGICSYIAKTYPYYRTSNTGWQFTIRSTLSGKVHFVKVQNGKNTWRTIWKIDPPSESSLMKQAFKSKRKHRVIRRQSQHGTTSSSHTPHNNATIESRSSPASPNHFAESFCTVPDTTISASSPTMYRLADTQQEEMAEKNKPEAESLAVYKREAETDTKQSPAKSQKLDIHEESSNKPGEPFSVDIKTGIKKELEDYAESECNISIITSSATEPGKKTQDVIEIIDISSDSEDSETF